jgi:ribosome biogenesis GTPase A
MGKVAIDKERTGELIEQIRSIFEPIIMALPAEVRGPVESVLMKPLFGLLQEFVSEARPPVFLFMGRSGHGKSTLVNALVGRKVAKVNPVKPESPSAEPYCYLSH